MTRLANLCLHSRASVAFGLVIVSQMYSNRRTGIIIEETATVGSDCIIIDDATFGAT